MRNSPDTQFIRDMKNQEIDSVFQSILDAIPLRVFWKDINHCYRGANLVFARDIGFNSVEEIIGKYDGDTNMPPEQVSAFLADDREVMQSGLPKLCIEEPQTRSDNSTYWLETNKIPIKNKSGKVVGLLGMYHDVTERVTARQEIEFQALHDQLTQLPNRRALMARMDALEKCTGCRGWSALLFLDLDQFKQVNDSLGHAVGDKLLQLVSIRINSVIDQKNALCRTGGDEFSVLLTKLGDDEEEALNIATSNAESIVASLSNLFNIDGHCLYVGVSIGFTIFPSSAKHLQPQLREADVAMYEAKSQGQNLIRRYTKVMRESSDRRHHLQNRLRQAVQVDAFHLVYQPQIGADGTLAGAEALLRWDDSEIGKVSPGEFIPLAEKTGAIHTIGTWVLGAALKQLVNWESRYQVTEKFKLAINISAVQFDNRDFVTHIHQIVSQYGVDKSRLELEITESFSLRSEASVLTTLNDLDREGFDIVIDDFGTGYSSLSYLTLIPFSKMKLDRSFVCRIASDKRQADVARAIVMLARTLNVRLTAEGIETARELETLKDLGTDFFQGYYFDAGLSPADFAARYFKPKQ